MAAAGSFVAVAVVEVELAGMCPRDSGIGRG